MHPKSSTIVFEEDLDTAPGEAATPGDEAHEDPDDPYYLPKATNVPREVDVTLLLVQERILELERNEKELYDEEDGKWEEAEADSSPIPEEKHVRWAIPDQTVDTHPGLLNAIMRGERNMTRALNGYEPKPLPSLEELRKAREKQKERRDRIKYDGQGAYILKRDCVGWYKDRTIDIAVLEAETFLKVAGKLDTPEVGVITLMEIDKYIQIARKREAEDDPLAEDEESLRALVDSVLPSHYHEYRDVFSRKDSDRLPPSRNYDHKIELTPGKRPEDIGSNPLYKMSSEELEACRQYILENLQKGWIEACVAPWAAPVIFVKKPNGGLRLCVDYRKLNSLTKKDIYPLPLIEETLSRVTKAKIFTKIDIISAFHRIKMDQESEELTAFKVRQGTYKYKVMPFGVTNGPATFQRFINDTLLNYLDVFCSAYIDDILIYSNSEEEHIEHVKKVLARLREAGLNADIKKCEFHVPKTKFLGFIVGVDGIEVDPAKVKAVKQWEEPHTVKGVQSFLGFCNFYRKFVPEYSRIARPLTMLTKKDQPFSWGGKQQQAFNKLKQLLLSAPVLKHFDFALPTRIETDASDGVLAGVLAQEHDDG